MSYFLCGQTGNQNRGCEAIVRSTVKVLGQRNGDIYLATFALNQDRKMLSELGINAIAYGTYPSRKHRYACALIKKINKKSLAGTKYIAADLYANMKKGDISLNIGGDTYCYGDPPRHCLSLNKFTSKHGIDNIFWCCSVEKDAIKGEVKRDIKRYKYIFAREQITFYNLIEAGIPKEKVVKVCDPAFFLDKKNVPLPRGFVEGNTVGLNVSECVLTEHRDSHVYGNILHLVRYILNETDMSICLIPHVYNIEKNSCDWPILNRILNAIDSDRVSIVDREYDCEQLKYIISKCRFMVCARTHASIAAYSSEVPTLVLGYSIKSKGIATDLFGTDENYVVSYTQLTEKQELTAAFKFIQNNENNIKQRLKEFLPEYRRQLTDAVNKYMKMETDPFSICDPNLCSGCGACAASCPKKCISMVPDDEGFLRPQIKSSLCVQCKNCKEICPAANKYSDDGAKPCTYAAINNDTEVRKSSSSGGVFTALAESVISNGGVVFGAVFNEELDVVHTYADTLEDVKNFRGSKYVQSKIGTSYLDAKRFLDSGRTVLFTGTPCQIGGLYAFLKCEYDNLYTQDIICHGVPSPKVWKKYVEIREREASSKVSEVFFRDKTESWKNYSVHFRFENNSEYKRCVTEDLYMRSFLGHFCLRPSCHICSFKQVHRVADITLADYWGGEKFEPQRNDDKGISIVMLHSEKGQKLFEQVKGNLEVWEVDFDKAVSVNTSMLFSSPSAYKRRQFMKSIDKISLDRLIIKYTKKSFPSLIIGKIIKR